MTAVTTDVSAPGRLRELLGARTVDEVLWDYQDRSRFVVEGLVHATTTLVYGLSEVGKTWLMVSMISALVQGESWLGQPIHGGPRRCLILAADAGGEWEYAERLGDGFSDMVLTAPPPPPQDLPRWERVAEYCVTDGYHVVIVDTLYAWAGATDVNSNKEVATPLACLRTLSAAGIAVVLVHHTNSGGRKPAGVHSIPAFFRHSLGVQKTTLRSHGNDAADTTYRLTRDGGRIVHATPKTKAEESQAQESGATSKQGRPKGRPRYEEAVAHLRQAPTGQTQRGYGRYLMERMDSVGSEDAGVGLMKALRKAQMWPPGLAAVP